MKHFLSLLFSLTIGYTASAQQSRSSATHTNINDDDKTLSIQVDGTVDGKSIQYNRRFNVKGMSIAQKDALKQHVFDSLGIGEPPKPPKPPLPPSLPKSVRRDTEEVTIECESCTGKMRLEISGSGFTLTHESDSKNDKEAGFPLTAAMKPGDYRLMYWQNKVLQIQSEFTVKAGEEKVVKVK